jgi:hypothetical protein
MKGFDKLTKKRNHILWFLFFISFNFT